MPLGMLLYPIKEHEANTDEGGVLRVLHALQNDLRFLHDTFNDPFIVCPPFFLCLIFDEQDPKGRERGMRLCLQWLKYAEEIWIFDEHTKDRYAKSAMYDELLAAYDRKLPVIKVTRVGKRKQRMVRSAVGSLLKRMQKQRVLQLAASEKK